MMGRKVLDGVSLKARKGEILGLAGVEGNGQHEILEAIAGMYPVAEGSIKLNGQNITNNSIRKIRDLGIAHIPEDRMVHGSAKKMNIMENILAGKHKDKDMNGKLFLNKKKIGERAEHLIEEYKIKCSGKNQEIGMLSGGNIQKVVVAREFSTDPQLILVDQPARGIDIGAATFIRERLVQLRDEGKAIILNSADLNEVLGLSDSLAIFYNGKVAAFFEDTSELTEEELGLYMLGVKKQTMEEGDDIK